MTELQKLIILGEKIRSARGELSQEYVALRLGRTKGWLSKVEHGKLQIDRATLKKFSQLVGWNETELEEALTLLQEKHQERSQDLIPFIEQQLRELESLVGKEGIASILTTTLREMYPFPTLPFLQFLVDLTTEALQRLKK